MARVPALSRAGIKRGVNGPIPYSPDGNPYIGPEPGLRNFFHCNTFSFGITQGGGAGKALAEW
jgi:dimethylglycine dehydrogenase